MLQYIFNQCITASASATIQIYKLLRTHVFPIIEALTRYKT